jgi:thymidylate kinase
MFKLIGIDGPDLAGKSTLIKSIIESNPDKYATYTILDQNKDLGKFIRDYLKKPLNDNSYKVFKHLFLANISEVYEEILDLLNTKNVILDRHILSTMIYGIDPRVHELAFFNEVKGVFDAYPIRADYNLYLNINKATFIERSKSRTDKSKEGYEKEDIFDKLELNSKRVMSCILRNAADMNISIINADKTEKELFDSVLHTIEEIEMIGVHTWFQNKKNTQIEELLKEEKREA